MSPTHTNNDHDHEHEHEHDRDQTREDERDRDRHHQHYHHHHNHNHNQKQQAANKIRKKNKSRRSSGLLSPPPLPLPLPSSSSSSSPASLHAVPGLAHLSPLLPHPPEGPAAALHLVNGQTRCSSPLSASPAPPLKMTIRWNAPQSHKVDAPTLPISCPAASLTGSTCADPGAKASVFSSTASFVPLTGSIVKQDPHTSASASASASSSASLSASAASAQLKSVSFPAQSRSILRGAALFSCCCSDFHFVLCTSARPVHVSSGGVGWFVFFSSCPPDRALYAKLKSAQQRPPKRLIQAQLLFAITFFPRQTIEPSRPYKDVATSTSDCGTMTEPDLLGPCEPGSRLLIEGVIWLETPSK
ncbi:unnamed protein product [Protopolystoma xenopodis]|uniref:Uncharacterized protein n=1 Tax=Protopolystoma xenopodis TaxID=117903 RepID=A0A3S5ANR3_9PLAT|nr:unnamed protein product [Protopolystoma xenopodis]